MAETQSNPIQILLYISVAILLVVGAGWLLLDSGSGDEAVEPQTVVADDASDGTAPEALSASDVSSEPGDEQAPGAAGEATATGASLAETAPSDPPGGVTDRTATVETHLRMARIAAQADMLVEPRGQSAVYFYSRVLAIEPEHAVARAELDAVLGRLAIRVDAMLEAEDYDQAYDVARRVVAVDPDHRIVSEVQQTFEQMANELIENALAQAEAGNEEEALALLTEAEALPGRNPDYIQAVRDSIVDLTAAFAAARAEEAERQRQIAEQAREEWAQSVRDAIAEGRLVGSGSDNAYQLLTSGVEDDDGAQELWQEWLDAVVSAATSQLESGGLEAADLLVTAAEESGIGGERVAARREELEAALAARESARVVPVAELTAINAEPAAFPRRAELRGISGWVRVEFTVDIEGATSDIEIIEAEPETLFNDSALAAVSAWTFEPREFRGQTIPQRASARLVFRLN